MRVALDDFDMKERWRDFGLPFGFALGNARLRLRRDVDLDRRHRLLLLIAVVETTGAKSHADDNKGNVAAAHRQSLAARGACTIVLTEAYLAGSPTEVANTEEAPSRPKMSPAGAALRPTRAEIDLGAIASNLSVVRQYANASKVLAVIKADAYGHGIVQVAQRLQQVGVDGFGVALAEEGLELRAAGIDRAILVLNGVHGGAHAEVVSAGLTPVLYELSEARAFHAASNGRKVDVHLKVDTGMGRLGVPMSKLDSFLKELASFESIRIAGLMTHLATADDDRAFVKEQLTRFDTARDRVVAAGHQPRVRHAANSAALFRHPESHFDWVRPGLALFGYSSGATTEPSLRPAMRLRSEIISLREIQLGMSVGYGQKFIAEGKTLVAAIPVGYGDGLFRSLSNKGHVLVGGMKCPILGNVSMDLTTVDVSGLPEASVGDEVVLLGSQGQASITADQIAEEAGTIAYEILTNVSRRVPRFYTS